jgi:hypothetical protein
MLMLQDLAKSVDIWTCFLYILHLFLVSYKSTGGGGAGAPDMKKTMCVLWLYPTSITVEYYLDISPK